MLVCMLVCWYVGIYVGMLVCWYVGMYVGMLVCMLVCWYVGMLVCWYVYKKYVCYNAWAELHGPNTRMLNVNLGR